MGEIENQSMCWGWPSIRITALYLRFKVILSMSCVMLVAASDCHLMSDCCCMRHCIIVGIVNKVFVLVPSHVRPVCMYVCVV